MTMNITEVLNWLNDFKHSWLSQNLLNDTRLIQLITNKLHELEQLLIQNNQHENEISIESEHQSAKSNDTEQHSTLPNTNNQIDNDKEKFSRPAIRLKRISLAEAENFLPPGWKPPKSKRGRKKSKKNLSKIYSPKKKTIQTNKVLTSSTQDEITNNTNDVRKSTRTKKSTQPSLTSSLTKTQSINSDKKKSKRKLRAIDAEDDDLYILGNLSQTENSNGINDCDQISRYIGQNGILSQTRKTNETIYNDDFTIRLPSRQSNQNRTKFSNHSNDTNINTIIPESGTIDDDDDDDVSPIDDEQIFQDVLENNDNESLFTSLDIINDKTPETNSILNNNPILDYNDCIEDITNDGIDPPPSTSSPNFGHLSLIT